MILKNANFVVKPRLLKHHTNLLKEFLSLDLINSDICELGVLTRNGKRYFITFIDNCSDFTFVYLMKYENEAFDIFKLFLGTLRER